MSKCINVKYEGKPLYNIVIEQSFDKLAEEFDKLGVTGRKLCIVSDSNVAPLYAKHIEEQLLKTGNKVFTFVFEAGEANKNLDTVETAGADITKMMEASVTPELGQNIDIRI